MPERLHKWQLECHPPSAPHAPHPVLNLAEEHSVCVLVLGRVTLNPCFLAISADRERLSTY